MVERLIRELGLRELEKRLLDLAVLVSLYLEPGLSEEEILELDKKIMKG